LKRKKCMGREIYCLGRRKCMKRTRGRERERNLTIESSGLPGQEQRIQTNFKYAIRRRWGIWVTHQFLVCLHIHLLDKTPPQRDTKIFQVFWCPWLGIRIYRQRNTIPSTFKVSSPNSSNPKPMTRSMNPNHLSSFVFDSITISFPERPTSFPLSLWLKPESIGQTSISWPFLNP